MNIAKQFRAVEDLYDGLLSEYTKLDLHNQDFDVKYAHPNCFLETKLNSFSKTSDVDACLDNLVSMEGDLRSLDTTPEFHAISDLYFELVNRYSQGPQNPSFERNYRRADSPFLNFISKFKDSQKRNPELPDCDPVLVNTAVEMLYQMENDLRKAQATDTERIN